MAPFFGFLRVLLQGEAHLTQSPSARVVVRSIVLCAFLALAAAPVCAVTRRAFATSVTGTGNLSSWADATSTGDDCEGWTTN